MSRLGRLALLALALLCAVTIGSGAAVARLLPARLALWHVPRVAAGAEITPAPVLPAASGSPARGQGQGAATAAGLSAALSGPLASPVLGSHVGMQVTDLATGQVLYSRAAGSGFAPASTAKLATALAALDILGPGGRVATSVAIGPTPDSIILVGGGDPTLTAGRAPASDYPQPPSLQSLAAATAGALRARGQTAVQLGYDTSLYQGPPFAPGWQASYLTTGNVSPITSLEVDQGRLLPSGAPQDADSPGNFRPRSRTPAADAVTAFAGYLSGDGIRVLGPASLTRADRGAAVLARVYSPPVAQMVQWMLLESNNVIAENLARQIAIARRQPASFAGAAAAENSVLGRLGAGSGVTLVDGSGLSTADRATPAALVGMLRLAAASPRLRDVITGLPVAGFAGTLAPGQGPFAHPGAAALGTVRAKTGNLASVAALAGVASARSGQLLLFAVMADRLPGSKLAAAAAEMDQVATILAGCGCR